MQDSQRKKWLTILTIASIVGLIVSFFLYSDSVNLEAGVGAGLYCKADANFGCAPALTSDYAKLFGVPLPVLAAAFYFAIVAGRMMLFWTAKDPQAGSSTASKEKDDKDKEGEKSEKSAAKAPSQQDQFVTAIARFSLAGYVGACALSLYLGYIALVVLPTPCKFCMILYAVNIVGLVASIKVGIDFEGFKRAPGAAIGSTLGASPVIAALFTCVVALGVTYSAYTSGVEAARAENEQEQTAKGQEAAEEIQAFEGETQIELKGLPRLGPADAPIVLVEFSDFECPYCQRFAETVHQLKDHFGDQIAIYFAHFPLDTSCNGGSGRTLHPSACFAARAAVCAQYDGKFWEMHDELFNFFKERGHSDEKMSMAHLLTIANKIDLNAEKLASCVETITSTKEVVRQIGLGRAAGAKSTPTWILNGHLRGGGHPFHYVKPQIDKLLELNGQTKTKK